MDRVAIWSSGAGPLGTASNPASTPIGSDGHIKSRPGSLPVYWGFPDLNCMLPTSRGSPMLWTFPNREDGPGLACLQLVRPPSCPKEHNLRVLLRSARDASQ